MEELFAQALAYAGTHLQDEKALHAMQALLPQLEAAAGFKACWQYYETEAKEDGWHVLHTSLVLQGKSAQTMLKGCHGIVVLAATLGHGVDQMLARMQKQDMYKALLLSALASALLETQLDAFCAKLAGRFENQYLSDRFSCGYGDLDLHLQPALVETLQLPKRLGIYCSASDFLQPSKSVTAFMGVSFQPQPARIKGCAFCTLAKMCQWKKKKGTSCQKPVV